jgi:hypothetical protein
MRRGIMLFKHFGWAAKLPLFPIVDEALPLSTQQNGRGIKCPSLMLPATLSPILQV